MADEVQIIDVGLAMITDGGRKPLAVVIKTRGIGGFPHLGEIGDAGIIAEGQDSGS